MKLLEVTHGQWLYRNVQVHDVVSGSRATQRKDKLRDPVLDQLDRGGEDLEEENKYLVAINLGDLDSASGEKQEYWLLAIEAARGATRLGRNEADDSAKTSQRRA